jgi:hypothetical protein
MKDAVTNDDHLARYILNGKCRIKARNLMHSRCFGIMGGHGNFAFNLVVKRLLN